MSPDPIRIRITPREPVGATELGPRESFWALARDENDSEQTIAGFEAQLCREFGRELRTALLQELAQPIHILDSELFPGSLRDIERWMFRFMDSPKDREAYRYQFTEAFSRLMEQRQQVIRDSPSLRQVQDRMAAAAGITFSTRLAGYSSLNLDILPGSFKQVATAFENDFDSFRVFLDAFVPVAFAGVFSESFADKLEFAVTVPASAERAFGLATTEATLQSQPQVALAPLASGPSSGRERAEWLWRLANGSLLIPVLLALLVMYQGMKMLTEMRAAQYDAVKPVLEHQLRLLEEDRHRLSRDVGPVSQPTSATPQVPCK